MHVPFNFEGNKPLELFHNRKHQNEVLTAEEHADDM